MQRYSKQGLRLARWASNSREEALLRSIPSRSKEIEEKIAGLQSKSEIIRQMELKKLQEQELLEAQPTIGDFKIPIFNTFVFASTVFLLFQWADTLLTKEQYLVQQQEVVSSLEKEIQQSLDKKKSSWFKFWADR